MSSSTCTAIVVLGASLAGLARCADSCSARAAAGIRDRVDRDAFEVQGVAPGNPTPRQLRATLRTLLEDRFALKLRTETQTIDVYALVPDRPDGTLGPKVEAWSGTCRGVAVPVPAEDDPSTPRCPSGLRPPGIALDGATMFNAAEALSLPLRARLLADSSRIRPG